MLIYPKKIVPAKKYYSSKAKLVRKYEYASSQDC